MTACPGECLTPDACLIDCQLLLEEEEVEELHESHDWNERRFIDGDGLRFIPYCIECQVDGFVNEPKAFKPCPGPKVKRSRCRVTMESRDDPGHLHRCLGGHTSGDHFCKVCHRWYGVRV